MNDEVLADSLEFANRLLDAVSHPAQRLSTTKVDSEATRNAAAFMTEFLVARLSQSGDVPQQLERTTFRWEGGLVNLRNAVQNEHWTNLRTTFVDRFREMKQGGPAVYLMSAWQPNDRRMHVWAIPEEVVFEAFPRHPVGKMKEKRTIRILPGVNRFERCTDSPDLTPYYREIEWNDDEYTKLIDAARTDETTKKRNREESETDSVLEGFFLKGKDSEATGTLLEDGFVVRAGAVAREEILPSAFDSVAPVRERLVADGILELHNGQLRFTRDCVFDSPSGAAAAVLGRSSNGWVEWKHAAAPD